MRIQMLLSLHLRDLITNPPHSLGEVIEGISMRVVVRGLTPESLDWFLRDEE